MQIWFPSNGSYSLKNCHNPFGKAIQPIPIPIPVEHLKSSYGASLSSFYNPWEFSNCEFEERKKWDWTCPMSYTDNSLIAGRRGRKRITTCIPKNILIWWWWWCAYQKMCWYYDILVWWYDDIMIWWYDDMMPIPLWEVGRWCWCRPR